METPLTDHITKEEFENIYEPSEDSFLLLDAIEDDINFIEQILQPSICLEIGSGSGIIITAVAKRFQICQCLSSDINLLACRMTKKTAIKNNAILLDSIQTNLANGFRDHIFDMIIFNPPYVVTSEEECKNTNNNLLTYTWAGGINGRTIINNFINNLDAMLNSNGVAYLLLLKENNIPDIIRMFQLKEFHAEILKERRIIGEHLYILKIKKINI